MSRGNIISGVIGCKRCIRKFGLYLQARLTFAQNTLNSTRERFKLIPNFHNASGTSLRLSGITKWRMWQMSVFYVYLSLSHWSKYDFGVAGDQKQFKVKKKRYYRVILKKFCFPKFSIILYWASKWLSVVSTFSPKSWVYSNFELLEFGC